MRQSDNAAEPEGRIVPEGLVALPCCATAHPLHPRVFKHLGTSISDAAARPGRQVELPALGGVAPRTATMLLPVADLFNHDHRWLTRPQIQL
jgi:hypothetical protein